MEAENRKKSRCTVEADLELLRRYQNRDQEALTVLFEIHYRFINFWVHKLSQKLSWVDLDDLMQLGRIGFWKAANKFKVSQYSYFHGWAKNSVLWEIYNSPEVRRVKRIQQENYDEVVKAQDKLMQRLNRKPTLEEIAKEAKLSKKQVDNALNAIAVFTFPLENAEGHIEVEDPRQIEELHKLEGQQKETEQILRDAIKQLNPGQAEVISRYYFSEPTTDSAIAEEMGKREKAITMKRLRAERKLRKVISRDPRWNPRILNSF